MQQPVIILAKGDFPKHSIPIRELHNANTIICCDGAINKLVKKGKEPDYIIGDMDSINNELKKKFIDRIIKITNQKDKQDLLELYNLQEPGLDKLIQLSYQQLGLITFFTADMTIPLELLSPYVLGHHSLLLHDLVLLE